MRRFWDFYCRAREKWRVWCFSAQNFCCWTTKNSSNCESSPLSIWQHQGMELEHPVDPVRDRHQPTGSPPRYHEWIPLGPMDVSKWRNSFHEDISFGTNAGARWREGGTGECRITKYAIADFVIGNWTTGVNMLIIGVFFRTALMEMSLRYVRWNSSFNWVKEREIERSIVGVGWFQGLVLYLWRTVIGRDFLTVV